MALVGTVIFLGLAHLLSAKPLDCEPLVPEIIDNATISKLLGKWFYIGGASQHPDTVQELESIKNAYFFLYPSNVQQDELLLTEIMRVKDKCVVDNSSSISVTRNTSTLTKKGTNESSIAQLIKSSSEDVMILHHIHGNYTGLTISARTHNASTEQLEEFKIQVACLGLKEEETFYTTPKDLCPMEEERDVEVLEPPLE
uniref:Apolipoprotein M n=1 Tax=Pelusios castaneus TaxID=367368 RepID=A0A8C8SS24_9SAUR